MVHVDEKRIVALNGIELDELELPPGALEAPRKLALLIDRKQEIARHTDYEDALGSHLLQARLDRAAMLGDVEKIARPR
jgi:hypothetical protein